MGIQLKTANIFFIFIFQYIFLTEAKSLYIADDYTVTLWEISGC